MRTVFISLLSNCIASTSLAQGDSKQASKEMTTEQIVTRHLFKQYVNTPVRIQTREVQAAIELVGTRGVNDPEFIRSALKALEISYGPQPESMRVRR